ncbi:phage N-6-adenine-methyltransferase [Glaesserella parasuis]|uniref:phage N-6-adenine-methyltransferase n=1 Tax=Glaesserella parasuis TaxID=738 RepID=UPI0038525F2D
MIIGNKTKTPKADKDLWATPWDVFWGTEKLLGRIFDLDACASPNNAKCERYITAEQDCLVTEWGESPLNVWINPPYSNPLPFIERAIQQSHKYGHFVVMLLPADTSVEWFELCVTKATDIWFITAGNGKGGRINFLHNADGKAKSGNSKGSMLVVFNGSKRLFHRQASVHFISREDLISKGRKSYTNPEINIKNLHNFA